MYEQSSWRHLCHYEHVLENSSIKTKGIMNKTIALVGGGPAALMLYRQLARAANGGFTVDIFESTDTIGSGMPYSPRGADYEHVTNVSADELPDLDSSLDEWVKGLPQETLDEFGIEREQFHEKEVVPRLLFGRYLHAQFESEIERASEKGLVTEVRYASAVEDIDAETTEVTVKTRDGKSFLYDYVIICTGHHWPHSHEGKVPSYFDSPYPPKKLAKRFNHTVAVRGSSLTAMDAISTMSKANGKFVREEHDSASDKKGKLVFVANDDVPDFRIVMHSRHGLLPCVRVHMEEPHVAGEGIIDPAAIEENMAANDGFLELDFLFEKGFKEPLKESDNGFYEKIKDMDLETFVDAMMHFREAADPFTLLKAEFEEARQSIKQERPVYWKEMLAALSFAINYPAKHLSAEDMLRLQKHLLPLISVVIAFMPQSSCEKLLALHEAGRLELIADGGGTVEVSPEQKIVYQYSAGEQAVKLEYESFVDCIGQPHLSIEKFPFKSLVDKDQISGARLEFRDQERGRQLYGVEEHVIKAIDPADGQDKYYLSVSGAAITDSFQVVDGKSEANKRLFLMAVPYMGGFNPDYSGLDFCEKASELIVDSIV